MRGSPKREGKSTLNLLYEPQTLPDWWNLMKQDPGHNPDIAMDRVTLPS
jgi:hypothetical protein